MKKRIRTTSSKQLDVIVIYAVAGILCGPFLVVVQLIGVALLYLFSIFFTIAVAALITLLLFLGAYRYCRDLAVTIAGVVLFVLLLLSSFGVAISIYGQLTGKTGDMPYIAIALYLLNFLVVVLLLPCLVVWSLGGRWRSVREATLSYTCRSCSYDLENIKSARCPECGQQNPFSQAVG